MYTNMTPSNRARPRDHRLHLGDAARRVPRRAAVVQAGRARSFEDLASRSPAGGGARGLGVRRGEPVPPPRELAGVHAAHYGLATMGAVIVHLNITCAVRSLWTRWRCARRRARQLTRSGKPCVGAGGAPALGDAYSRGRP